MEVNVKEGYKKTDIGLIPIDWEENSLESIGDFVNGKPHESKVISSGEHFLITIDSINIDGELKAEHKRINSSGNFLHKGDIVIILSDIAHGYLLGLCDVIPEDNKYVLNQRVGRLSCHTEFAPQYIRYQINRNQNHFRMRGQGTSQRHIYKRDIDELFIPIPYTFKEQKTIAEVLSDVDGYIESLEKLIAKKRMIKQGAMQELLTGKRQLSGFRGKWKEKKIEDITEIVSGGTPRTKNVEYWDGQIDWCTPTDITNTKGKYLCHTERRITESGLKNSSASLLPPGTLLLCSRATIGEVKIAAKRICTNQGFKCLICSDEVQNEFLYYLILTMKSKLIEKSNGSTFLEISKKDIGGIEIKLPLYDEQNAIVEILSDMDEEIIELEKKLRNVCQIKQGMMQELLTGKIRLI